MYKLLIMCSCKCCGVKSANSWTFPAFLTLFNGALWSLRFTSLGERKLGPTMLGNHLWKDFDDLGLKLWYVLSFNTVTSLLVLFKRKAYPRKCIIQDFDKTLCILNWQENKRSQLISIFGTLLHLSLGCARFRKTMPKLKKTPLLRFSCTKRLALISKKG